MFGIGGFELFLIVVFIFVVFGPDKMPEITKLAGAGIRKFRKAKKEMDQVLQEEVIDPVMKEANKPDPPKQQNKKKTSSATSQKTAAKSKTATNKNQDKTKKERCSVNDIESCDSNKSDTNSKTTKAKGE